MPITILNSTRLDATCVVLDQTHVVLGKVDIAPQHYAQVPTRHRYTIVAESAGIDAPHRTASLTVTAGGLYIASLVHDAATGSEVFAIRQESDGHPELLQLAISGLARVDFTINRDDVLIHAGAVDDAEPRLALPIPERHVVFAVVNGITSERLAVSGGNAVLTVVEDEEMGASTFRLAHE